MKQSIRKAYTNTEFLLSPEADPVRKVADSLYPQYLRNRIRHGHKVMPAALTVLDEEFILSPDARWVRIIAESIYAELKQKKEKVYHTVVFFGSARLISKEQAEAVIRKKGVTPEEIALAEKSLKMSRYYDEARELSRRMTVWSLENGNANSPQPFVVCTGGGPAIMEAGNRGAMDAGGKTIGLNISLPFEQEHNPYVSPELNFEFHYFFTRKYHFSYRAKALVVFPGGYGSMDELFEMLTLVQNQKIMKKMKIILYGPDFWKKAINFDYLHECGVISQSDLKLFEFCDNVEEAFALLSGHLKQYLHHY
jgi:uncharacterized protein (TIGR00730 family)